VEEEAIQYAEDLKEELRAAGRKVPHTAIFVMISAAWLSGWARGFDEGCDS